MSLAVLLAAAGCGSTGWLPSLTLAAAGVRRIQAGEALAGRDLQLRTDARLSWRLQSTSNTEIGDGSEYGSEYGSRYGFESAGGVDGPGRDRCAMAELCEWEMQERERALQSLSSDR